MRSLVIPLLLLWPSIVAADVISPTTVFPPAPTDCARGSIPQGGGHGIGPRCLPSTCTSDRVCNNARGACQRIGLCIESVQGGHVPPYDVATGACRRASDCPSGRCEIARRCGNTPARRPRPARR